MAPRGDISEKPKRRKKRKSRTEVSSDSSDIESADGQQAKGNKTSQKEIETNKPAAPSGQMSDAKVSAAFTKFYMQRMATEFSEDLDRLRSADDFKDDAIPLLINALQQGTSLFSIGEQRRIVMAGVEREKKAKDA